MGITTLTTKSRSIGFHHVQNLALLSFCLFFLPLGTTILICTYLLSPLIPGLTKSCKLSRPTNPKTVLVTGVGMAKGLTIARLFHRAGHRVIGVDTRALSLGAVSKAVHKFYRLPYPSDDTRLKPNQHKINDEYINKLLRIVIADKVDIWISVSDVHSPVQDALAKELIEAKTNARCIQFGLDAIRTLDDKGSFMHHSRPLGLSVPDFAVVRTQEGIISFLAGATGLAGARTTSSMVDRTENTDVDSETNVNVGDKRFILKPIGVDDPARFSLSSTSLLPLATQEETLSYIRQLPLPPSEPISSTTGSTAEYDPDQILTRSQPPQSHNYLPESSTTSSQPFLLQEFIPGKYEFCTHALIIRGQVRAFVACPSSDLLMHYDALPPESVLSKKMLEFTKKQASTFGEGFTGHLSFDFLVRFAPAADEHGHTSRPSNTNDSELRTKEHDKAQIYAVECNPRAHTAVVLFNETEELVDAYLSILDNTKEKEIQSAFGNEDVGSVVNSGNHNGGVIYDYTYHGPELGSDEQRRRHQQRQRPQPSESKRQGQPKIITPAKPAPRYYWIGQDLFDNVIYPTYPLVRSILGLSRPGSNTSTGKKFTVRDGLREYLTSLRRFRDHVLNWKDGTFETWDPTPWWWLYFVFWPAQFVRHILTGERWGRINVSTGRFYKVD